MKRTFLFLIFISCGYCFWAQQTMTGFWAQQTMTATMVKYELSEQFYFLVDSIKSMKPQRRVINEENYMVEFHCEGLSEKTNIGVMYKIHKYHPNDQLINGVCIYGNDTIFIYGQDGLSGVFIPTSDSISMLVCRNTFYLENDSVSCYCETDAYDPIFVIPYKVDVP